MDRKCVPLHDLDEAVRSQELPKGLAAASVHTLHISQFCLCSVGPCRTCTVGIALVVGSGCRSVAPSACYNRGQGNLPALTSTVQRCRLRKYLLQGECSSHLRQYIHQEKRTSFRPPHPAVWLRCSVQHGSSWLCAALKADASSCFSSPRL